MITVAIQHYHFDEFNINKPFQFHINSTYPAIPYIITNIGLRLI